MAAAFGKLLCDNGFASRAPDPKTVEKKLSEILVDALIEGQKVSCLAGALHDATISHYGSLANANAVIERETVRIDGDEDSPTGVLLDRSLILEEYKGSIELRRLRRKRVCILQFCSIIDIIIVLPYLIHLPFMYI